MTENIDSLVLEHLRAIRGTLTDHGERLGRWTPGQPEQEDV